MLNVYIPEKTGIFAVAAKEFSSFYTRMTGDKVKIATKPATKGDMVVFGSDAVNAYTHSKIIDKTIPQFSIITNSDEYQIVSAEENGRNLLFFAGGRPRAMLYAVYHFFDLDGYLTAGIRAPKTGNITEDKTQKCGDHTDKHGVGENICPLGIPVTELAHAAEQLLADDGNQPNTN